MESMNNFRERAALFLVLLRRASQLPRPGVRGQRLRHTESANARQGNLWKHRSAGRAVATFLGVLGLVLGSVTLTQADVINCGDVLGPGGLFQLEHDVTCPSPERAITIQDGAVLDLNGHTVTCNPPGIRCVVLTGKKAQLWNGTVDGAEHESITLEGTGRHTVWNVTSTPLDSNIIVTSDHNWLINVRAESGTNPAFNISGDHNRLVDSMAHCPSIAFGGCISVSGDKNHLIGNSVSVDEDLIFPGGFGVGGIRVTGDDNRLRLNHVTNREGVAIVVVGNGNDIRFNTAQGGTLDLQDTNGDCTHNTWKFNIFTTSDPACIDAGGARDKVAAK